MMFGSLRSLLDKFWFEPKDPLPMGIFRLLIGLISLQFLIVHLLPDLFEWFGPNAFLSNESFRQILKEGPRIDVLRLLPNTDLSVVTVFGTTVLAASCLTVGLFTRLSAVVTWLGVLSLCSHNPLVYQAPQECLLVALFFLIFSSAGKSLSLDSIKHVTSSSWRDTFASPRPEPAWAQRMVQIWLTLLYFKCALTKVLGSAWLDGSAVYYSSRLDGCAGFEVPYVFDHLWTIRLLTWGTLIVEASLATLVWYRPFRYWVLAAGALLHLSIGWTMNMSMFQMIFLASYVTFIAPEDIRRVAKFLERESKKSGAWRLAAPAIAAMLIVVFAAGSVALWGETVSSKSDESSVWERKMSFPALKTSAECNSSNSDQASKIAVRMSNLAVVDFLEARSISDRKEKRSRLKESWKLFGDALAQVRRVPETNVRRRLESNLIANREFLIREARHSKMRDSLQ